MTARTLASRLSRHAAEAIDTILDLSIVPGYSRIGIAARHRLPTWPADPEPGSLRERDVVITGATSGIGTALAAQIAALGGRVHLLVRDPDKGARLAAELPGEAEVWPCDLSDLDSVRTAAGLLDSHGVQVHALIHNAGVLPPERTLTSLGHELSMTVHVLSPLLLTDLLHDRLTSESRVIFVTSGGMYTQRLPVEDPDYLDGSYSGATAYARSKRTQVDLLEHCQRRWPGTATSAMHPGWVATPGVASSLPTFNRLTSPILRSPEEGADTATWLAGTTPRPVGGKLWHDRRQRPTALLPGTASTPGEREQMWRWACTAADLTL